MRRIATLPDSQAERFADYLLTQGIATRLDSEQGQTDVWVCDENQLTQARGELEAFQRDPDSSRYTAAAKQAATIRKAEANAEEAYRVRSAAFRNQMLRLGESPPMLLTWSLVLASGLIFFAMHSGQEQYRNTTNVLRIDSHPEDERILQRFRPMLDDRQRVVWLPTHYLPDVAQGQVWRLWTPMLMHFTVGHLFMNMMALIYLGGALETRYGTGRFLLLILGLALVSNLAEYFLGAGWAWIQGVPVLQTHSFFGGMSGVVYGLFGFLWYKSRYRPESGFSLPPLFVVISMAWFVLCWTGAFGPIANVAHTAGLALGWLWAMLPERAFRRVA
jgi:GlpG protein